jgi:hypothetical protein
MIDVVVRLCVSGRWASPWGLVDHPMRLPGTAREARQSNDQPVRREEVGAEMIAGGRVARLCPRRRWTSVRRRRLHLVRNPMRRCCNSANRSFLLLGATGCLYGFFVLGSFGCFVWVW